MATFSDLAKAKLYSKVKAINERVAEIARRWGRNSAAYQAFERAIYKSVPESQISMSKAGNIRIKQGIKNIDELSNNPDFLTQIERTTKTAGQYRKSVEESYRKTYGDEGSESGQISFETLRQFDESRNAVREAAESGALKQYLSGDDGRANDPRSERRRLTYDELFKIMDKINEERKESAAPIEEIISGWIGKEAYNDNVPFEDD